jgi:hypothetical protein
VGIIVEAVFFIIDNLEGLGIIGDVKYLVVYLIRCLDKEVMTMDDHYMNADQEKFDAGCLEDVEPSDNDLMSTTGYIEEEEEEVVKIEDNEEVNQILKEEGIL